MGSNKNVRRISRRFAFILIVILSFSVNIPLGFAGQNPVISIPDMSLNAGVSVNATISFDTPQSAAGFQFDLLFDPNIFDISENVAFDPALRSWIKVSKLSDSSNGIKKLHIHAASATAANLTNICTIVVTTKFNAPRGNYQFLMPEESSQVYDGSAIPKLLSIGTKDCSISVTKLSAPETGGGGPVKSSGGSGEQITETPIPTIMPTPAVTSTPTPTPTQVSTPETEFADKAQIPDWASTAVEEVAKRNIISGFPDGTFKPNDNVTREQFIKMLVSAFNLSDESADTDFTDVKKDEWYNKFISIAQKKGLTNGKGDGTFGVGEDITRQEMAVLAFRAASIAGIKLPPVKSGVEFTDRDVILDYAVDSISAMQQAGIIDGTDSGKFEPLGNATRAQAAKVIFTIVNLSKEK